MEEQVQPTEQSTVLNETEVQQVIEGEGTDDVQLPSDAEQFEMPEKFAGKSAEEIAKAYMELEKLRASKAEEQEGGDSVSEEEAPKEEDPKETKEPTPLEAEKLQEYEAHLAKEGTLTDDMYKELEEAGYSREQVDREIEFRDFQTRKSVEELTGDTIDKFKEVVKWAQENKTPEEIAEFNEALKGSNKLGQQALLKTLYAEAASGTVEDVTIHSNKAPTQAPKGYATESELFADMNNPAYKNDPKYQQKVMAKLEASDTTGWSF